MFVCVSFFSFILLPAKKSSFYATAWASSKYRNVKNNNWKVHWFMDNKNNTHTHTFCIEMNVFICNRFCLWFPKITFIVDSFSNCDDDIENVENVYSVYSIALDWEKMVFVFNVYCHIILFCPSPARFSSKTSSNDNNYHNWVAQTINQFHFIASIININENSHKDRLDNFY